MPLSPAESGTPTRAGHGRLRYVLSHLLRAAIVLWGAFTLTFVLLNVLPGDAILTKLESQSAGAAISDEEIAQLQAEYGLDRPLVTQYVDRLAKTLIGDLGRSIRTGASVSEEILSAVTQTAQLAGAALVLGVSLGLLLGTLSAFPRSARARELFASLPPLAISIPTFAAGLVLMQTFAFTLRLLPSSGNQGLAALILPAVTLALPVAATVAQVFAASIGQTLAEPFIATVRATGARAPRVLFAHVVRNSITPTLAISGLLVGSLLAGAAIVETVFSREGLGRVTVSAVTYQDFPVIQGVVLFTALVFVVVNVVVDVGVSFIDPRTATRGRQ